jgi:hypothetical protein
VATHQGRAEAASGGGHPVAVAEETVVRGSSGNLAEGVDFSRVGRPTGRPGLAGLVIAPVGWALRGAWHLGSSAIRGLLS